MCTLSVSRQTPTWDSLSELPNGFVISRWSQFSMPLPKFHIGIGLGDPIDREFIRYRLSFPNRSLSVCLSSRWDETSNVTEGEHSSPMFVSWWAGRIDISICFKPTKLNGFEWQYEIDECTCNIKWEGQEANSWLNTLMFERDGNNATGC